MKTRLSITANVFACLLIAGMPGFWGCASMDGDENGDNDMSTEKENGESPNEIRRFNNWELAGYVNGTDGTIQIPEKRSKDCFQIIFSSDNSRGNTLFGKSAVNAIAGFYEINEQSFDIKINVHFATEMMGPPDDLLFLEHLNSSYCYSITEDTLKLYYAKNDYLLFTYEGEKSKIVPKSGLSEALTKSLDSIFSAKNALASDIKFTSESLLFVIDNPQEFLTVCDDAAISTQINFEENCLIWGKFKSPSISNKIAGSELLEVRKNVYTYEIVMDWCVGCYTAIGVHYFWSIHPKISNKDIQLIIKENGKNDMTFPQEVVEAVDIASALKGECHWQYEKGIALFSHNIYVINSQESLSKFVSCDEIYQTVDFNEKTLLFAHGSTPQWLELKSYKLIQLSQDDFRLDVEIEQGAATIPGSWRVALLIPKIAQNATVNLNVNLTGIL